jgi:pyruvate,water dikinase
MRYNLRVERKTLPSTFDRLKDWLTRRRQGVPPRHFTPPAGLLERYRHYKRLLAANSAILAILADLQHKRDEEYLFDMAYLRGAVNRLEREVETLVDALISLSGGGYRGLETARQKIAARLRAELTPPEIAPEPLTLPLAQVKAGAFYGGKAEKLGELVRKGFPVPRGFAVSAYAQRLYFQDSGLENHIREAVNQADIRDLESLRRTGEAIREKILATPLPAPLVSALREQLGHLGVPRVAVRSSGLQEDGLASFAGQFETFLNVPPEQVPEKYQEVLASQFTPRALYYCHARGFSYQEMAMGVLIMEMVAAKAAGVVYTADPRTGEAVTIIHAVRGLGTGAVGGQLEPDVYRVKNATILEQHLSHGTKMHRPAPGGGVQEAEVGTEYAGPCLTPEQVLELAALAARAADHFGVPQDLEWALDSRGQLWLLQARPLRLARAAKRTYLPPRLKEVEVLVESGRIASRGAAAGPVYLLSDGDLGQVPPGVVLVTASAPPEYGLVVGRVAAVVSEGGSVTSHLATVLREAGVPALFGVRDATRILKPGQVVTVDAYYGNIYPGRQEALLKAPTGDSFVRQTRAWQTLDRLLKHITPLNLMDPRSKNFVPEGCETYHDITRFAHEKAMVELFEVTKAAGRREYSRQLKSTLPLEIHVVDLGGGLRPEALESSVITPEDIVSAPMQAYWRGMCAVGWKGPKPLDLAGFISVVMGAASDTNPMDRLQEENYALIAADYLNFSSRLGYHFTTVEAFFGSPDDSYITLVFYGGGADLSRRVRRVEFLRRVLEHLEFRVETKGDSITARLDGKGPELLAEKLELLGRLIMVSKQLDITMDHDALVESYYQEFITTHDLSL